MEATIIFIILASTLASSSSLMTTTSSTFSALFASTMMSLAEGEVKQFFLREPDNQTAIEGEQVQLKQQLPLWKYDQYRCEIQRTVSISEQDPNNYSDLKQEQMQKRYIPSRQIQLLILIYIISARCRINLKIVGVQFLYALSAFVVVVVEKHEGIHCFLITPGLHPLIFLTSRENCLLLQKQDKKQNNRYLLRSQICAFIR